MVPGLLDAARRPFHGERTRHAVVHRFGNHDGLIQGNFPPSSMKMNAVATGELKLITRHRECPRPTCSPRSPADYSAFLRAWPPRRYVRNVTPDADRKVISRAEVVEQHFQTTGLPVGPRLHRPEPRRRHGVLLLRQDGIRFVVMDTVNPNGYADGRSTRPSSTGCPSGRDPRPSGHRREPPHLRHDEQPAGAYRARHRAAG